MIFKKVFILIIAAFLAFGSVSVISADDAAAETKSVTESIVTVEFSRDVMPPANISGVTQTIGTRVTAFSWINPKDRDFAGVQIYRDGVLIDTVVNNNEFKDSGLTKTTSYKYLFKTVDHLGNASNGVLLDIVTLDDQPPSEVTDLHSTRTHTSFSFIWKNPTEEDYATTKVYRNGVLMQTGTTGYYYDDQLAGYEMYTYKITTVSKSGVESLGISKAMFILHSNSYYIDQDIPRKTATPTLTPKPTPTPAPTATNSINSRMERGAEDAIIIRLSDFKSGKVTVPIPSRDMTLALPITVAWDRFSVAFSGNESIHSMIIRSEISVDSPSSSYRNLSKFYTIEFLGIDGLPLSGSTAFKLHIPVSSEAALNGNVYLVLPEGHYTIIDSTMTVGGKLVSQAISGEKYVVAMYQSAFTDTAEHWAAAEIAFLASKHIVEGYEDQSFKPNAVLNRAEYLAIMTRVLSYDAKYDSSNVLSGISQHAWYYPTFMIGYQRGLILGSEIEDFIPEEEMTKEDMITIASRVLEAAGVIVTEDGSSPIGGDVEASTTDLPFNDAAIISPWAVDPVIKALAAGLIQGNETGKLEPGKIGTKAEAVVLATRLLKLIMASR